MHVVILPSSYPRFYKPISGVFYRDQALALVQSGVTVGVVDPSPRAIRTWRSGNVASQRFQVTSLIDDGIQTMRAHDWCLPYLRRMYARQFVWRANSVFDRYVQAFGRPDVIHAQELLWAGVGARSISQRTGVPYIVTEHSGGYALDPLEAWKVPHLRSSIAGATALLAVSTELATRMEPFGDGRPFRIVPNLVDTAFFHPPADRAPADGFLFVSVASQDMHKGIDILLRAFAAAFAGDSRVRLEIGGEGRDQPAFEALARQLGVTAQVTWLGQLARAQVADCYRRADAFVMTSRYETFGVAFIEAMSTGLPVIATRCGGPQEFITPDCGALVDVANVDQTTAALAGIYRDRDQWRRRAPAIREYVIGRFGHQVVARQLAGIYEESVGNPPRGHVRDATVVAVSA